MRMMIKLLLSEENVRMQYEIVLMLLLLLLPSAVLKDRKKLAFAWGAVFLFFIYIHRILLPFIISGAYFFVLTGISWSLIRLNIKAFGEPLKIFAKRLYGMLDRGVLPCAAVVLIILLIQLCRINISPDYDSLRYGLRSDVLLSDNGIKGFFEGMGLVNGVYSYPKGFELITWPLLFGHTYGYVLCFNIWILIAVILLSGEITAALAGNREIRNICIIKKTDRDNKKNRSFCMGAMLISLVPGITNMSVTAKSDLITLMCQLIFVLCVIKYLTEINEECGRCKKDEVGLFTGLGVSALILSYSFKPTSLIFSSALGLAAAAYLICNKYKLKINKNGLAALLLSCAFTAVITLRTVCITGMPFTSVFSGLFSRLGFKLKYPLAEQFISAPYGEAAGLAEKIQSYLSRLMHFLFCPTGADMEHVIMAWGGLVFVVMLFAAVIMYKKMPEKTAGFMYAALMTVMAISLISLALLYQIDGNYYELFYALSVITGAAAVSGQLELEESEFNENKRVLFGGSNGLGVIALTVAMIYFTAFTGWSGANGFTPIDFINRGYYNHEAEYGIKNPLGWDKHTRVIAFSAEPDCYKLKGRVESLTDICGSLGNVYLVKSLNIFKEYLSRADIDYIYADISYLKENADDTRARARELFKDLIEDGDFEEIVYEENSSELLYCKIDKDRVSVDWEIPMDEELAARTEKQEAFAALFK